MQVFDNLNIIIFILLLGEGQKKEIGADQRVAL